MLPRLDPDHIILQTAAREVGFLAAIVALCLFAAWILFIVLGARWIFRDASRRGHSGAVWSVCFIILSLFGLLPGAFLLLIYMLVRRPVARSDDKGQPVVPPAPGPAPAAGFPDAAATTPMRLGAPPAAPAPLGATGLSRVKCPRCQSIFQYQKALQGPTHVKCPSCGEEGNI